MSDQAKPTPRPYVEYGKEQVFCHNYILTLAKLLNLEDVREVPEKLRWLADNTSFSGGFGWTAEMVCDHNIIRAALAAGGEED